MRELGLPPGASRPARSRHRAPSDERRRAWLARTQIARVSPARSHEAASGRVYMSTVDCEEMRMQMIRDAAGTAPPTHTTVASPLGDLTVVSRAGATTGLYFASHWYRPDPRSFGAKVDV